MSPFEKYRQLVLEDRAMQLALDAAEDSREFAAMASRQARDHGLELTIQEILDALERARQAWTLRTLP